MTSDVTSSRGPSVAPSRDVTPSRARNVTPSRERMAHLRRRRKLDQYVVNGIRIAASAVDALGEKGYLEAGAPIHEAIEAYSDLLEKAASLPTRATGSWKNSVGRQLLPLSNLSISSDIPDGALLVLGRDDA
jgi:predicted solute-binding protein